MIEKVSFFFSLAGFNHSFAHPVESGSLSRRGPRDRRPRCCAPPRSLLRLQEPGPPSVARNSGVSPTDTHDATARAQSRHRDFPATCRVAKTPKTGAVYGLGPY